MRLAVQWTLIFGAGVAGLILAAAAAVELQLRAQAGAQERAWQESRRAQLQERLVLLGERAAAASTELAHGTELPAVLAPLATDGLGLRRAVVDWASENRGRFGVDELLVLDGAGRVVTSAREPASYGRPYPQALQLQAADAQSSVLWRARIQAGPAGASAWMVGTARRLQLLQTSFLVIAGMALDDGALATLAQLASVRSLRWEDPPRLAATPNEPAPGTPTMTVGLPASWRVSGLAEAPRLWADPGPPPGSGVLAATRQRLAVAAGVLLAVTLLAAPLVARSLAAPLARLTHGVRALGVGAAPRAALDLPRRGPQEVRELSAAVGELLATLAAEQQRARSAERRAAWREIARRIAHELKNALTPVTLALDNVETAVARGLDDPAARLAFKSSLATARDQLRSLDRLVTEFREFARAPRLALADADARALCLSALAGARAAHPRTSFVLQESENPGALRADAEQLRRALHNLLTNAAEAGAAGPVELLHGAGPVEDHWWIAVRDRGPGLPEEIAARLGEPYLTTKDRGTGLGLAIVMQIAEAHGGRLEPRPRPGGGLEMRLTMARRPPQPEELLLPETP